MTTNLWKFLLRLPTELFGAVVLTMLELQDCVRLDSAADKQSRLLLAQALTFYRTHQPIEVDQQHDLEKLKWLHERSTKGLSLLVTESFDYCEYFKKYESTFTSMRVEITDEQSILADLAAEPKIAVLVKSIDFSGIPDIECLKDVPRLLRNVEQLEWCHSREAESWCAQLLSNNPGMKRLRMYGLNQPLSADLVEAIVLARQLDELTLVFPDSEVAVEDFTFRALAAAAAAATDDICLPLRKLKVASYQTTAVGADVGCWLPLAQRCPLLQELTLEGVRLLDEADAVALVQACPHLQSVYCEKSSITDALLDVFSSTNLPLESIHMDWAVTSIVAVERAATLLSRLHTANLTIQRSIRPSISASLSAALELMTSLRVLTLDGTAECLAGVAGGSTALTRIELSRITPSEGTDIDVEACLCAIAQRNPGLREVALYKKEGLSDAFLQALAAHCPGLEVLRVTEWLSTLTDAGVVALAEGCARLQSVFFYSHNAEFLTDVSVLALAKGCPRLIHFSCPRATALTEKALVQLFHSCRRLSTLQVSNVAMMPIASLRKQRPRFRCYS